ncbi:MAG: hypothetical protein P4L39_10085 [Humidesulfovibrio sp.]|nr:hypothetical protein [Humidesulfovibrio sp.]
MQVLWRTLPRLALPAAMGLGLAYLATGFLPRPEPTLRPPEELRAHGLGLDEDSPVRAILERNVLRLQSPPFALPDTPLAPPTAPDAATAALAKATAPEAGAQPLATFAPPEPVLTPKGSIGRAGAALSGGPSVQGMVAPPQLGGPKSGTEADAGIEAFRLVGVVAGGPEPVAMFQAGGKALSLHPGEQALGWTLVEVRPGQALLARSQQKHWLTLAPAKAP